MNYQDFFRGKRVTVMGLGVLGRGVGDTLFLAECGARLTVTDMKTEAELGASIEKLKAYPDITYHLGGHRIEDFTNADMIIKAAGVPYDSEYIGAARDAKVPVYMSTALLAKFAAEVEAVIVGVTGTRGKSTVSQMIYASLQHAGRKSYLGGNVRGVSSLAFLPKIARGDILVLELDSWQLQGFGELGISPHISIFTNLMPDHMNYYHGDMEKYFADKANIFKNQSSEDIVICGRSIATKISESNPKGRCVVPSAIPENWILNVVGSHNRENASFAAEALVVLGLAEEEVRAGLEAFEPVEGRLQFVGEKNGAKIYNDNNATTPEATIAALRALAKGKNVILLMGGSDKGLDMSALLYEIASTCKRVILLAGTGTSRIVPLISDYSIYDSIDTAVSEAIRSASPGDIVLFSPAFASFGMFKNEYERNDLFMNAVHDQLVR